MDFQNLRYKTTRSRPALDPVARRKLLFSLSQPTNPVAGALLAHIETQASPAAINAWERNGWIRREGGNFYLTETGSEVLRTASPPPPDSFYPFDYR